jgi:hypothetical protein
MAYFVEGLVRTDANQSTVRSIGQFERLDEAIAAAEEVIRGFLETRRQAGMSARELFALYRDFGEIPFVFQDSGRTLNVPSFNHFKRALALCQALCEGTGTAEANTAHEAFPPLISDDQFDLLRQHHQLADSKRDNVDFWDTTAARPTGPQTDGLPESTIEQKYPTIAETLVRLWSSDACSIYLQRLINEDRTAKVQFPLDVANDLNLLHGLNSMRLSRR